MALTALDLNARQVLVTVGYHLVGRAEHPISLAEEMVEFWKAVVREQRGQGKHPLRKTPTNPHFAAVSKELLARIEVEEESKP